LSFRANPTLEADFSCSQEWHRRRCPPLVAASLFV
jgi:hypothetical protein